MAPRHILLAGGSVAEWISFSDEQWHRRLDDLIELAQRAGACFVTVHPHDPSGLEANHVHDRTAVATLRRQVEGDGVIIVVDPVVDGRERIVDVVETWPRHRRVTEKRLSRALFGRAGEPDLVVVLGSKDRLPRSLVWELAYGELFFLDVPWSHLAGEHLRTAIDDFARRQRRFGGVE